MSLKIFNSLVKKEVKQIVRDPSNVLVAFLLPLVMMLIFGYAINLDTNTVKIGVLVDGYKDQVKNLVDSFKSTEYLNTTEYYSRKEMEKDIISGKIKAMVIIPSNFAKNLYSGTNTAQIQLLIDGSDPNTSTFIEGYIAGTVNNWLTISEIEKGQTAKSLLNIQNSVWFNPELKSINFILPSSISMIITLVGMMLTALVIAREWERGTMESLLTTEISKLDIILSKFVAYYGLTMLSVLFCSFMCIVWFKIPFHGSYLVYFITASLFAFTSLGQGLLVSTLCKNQFLASITVAMVGLLPATMLSGTMFEISSMPKIIQLISYIVPARYFSACIRNLFNAGNIWSVLMTQSLFMIVFSIVIFFFIYKKTQTRLE